MEGVLADARYYHAPPETIVHLEAEIAKLRYIPPFPVWEENELAVGVFLSICNQWLISPHGGFLGLDGAVLLQYIALHDLDNDKKRKLYNDVQLIASAAITEWRKRTEQQQSAAQGDGDDDE